MWPYPRFACFGGQGDLDTVTREVRQCPQLHPEPHLQVMIINFMIIFDRWIHPSTVARLAAGHDPGQRRVTTVNAVIADASGG